MSSTVLVSAQHLWLLDLVPPCTKWCHCEIIYDRINVYYCNHENVYFDVSVTSRGLQTSRGFVSEFEHFDHSTQCVKVSNGSRLFSGRRSERICWWWSKKKKKKARVTRESHRCNYNAPKIAYKKLKVLNNRETSFFVWSFTEVPRHSGTL